MTIAPGCRTAKHATQTAPPSASAPGVRPPGATSVSDFGCVGDGQADDSSCFQAAVSSSIGHILFVPAPARAYRIRKRIAVTGPITITSNGARIVPDFPPDCSPADSYGFLVTSSNVMIENLWFDGSGLEPLMPLVVRTAIGIAGQEQHHVSNVVLRNNRFTNLMQYSLDGDARHSLPYILGYFNGVYAHWVDDLTIQSNTYESLSGAAVFLLSTNDCHVLDNVVRGTIIYSIHLDAGTHGTEIGRNILECGSLQYCRYWGGAIDAMGQHSHVPDVGPDTDVYIHDNTISGLEMYGAAVRFGSSQQVLVEHNTIRNVTPYGPLTSLISVSARGGAGTNMATRNPKAIVINDNTLEASGTSEVGIYLQNNLPDGASNLPSGQDIVVTNNSILSKDASDYFQNGIIVHGMNSGYSSVEISGNTYSGRPLAGPVAGAIALIAYSDQGRVTDVTITDNRLSWFTANGQLSPAPTGAFGLLIGQHSDVVRAEHNTLDGFGAPIWVDAQAGHDLWSLADNDVRGSVPGTTAKPANAVASGRPPLRPDASKLRAAIMIPRAAVSPHR